MSKSYLIMRRMGFTDYETTAYLTLSSKTRMTAKDLSQKTRIPITRVYETLDSLKEKGFIKAYPGRPRFYEFIPPDQTIKEFLQYREDKYNKEMFKIKALGEELTHQIKNDYWKKYKINAEDILKNLPTLSSAQIETNKIVDQAKEHVFILTAVFGWIIKAKQSIEHALSRGVKFDVLLLSPDADISNISREIISENFRIRSCFESWFPLRYTISDNKKAVFILWASTNKETFWKPIIIKPYLTAHPGIVRSLRDTFEKMWTESNVKKD